MLKVTQVGSSSQSQNPDLLDPIQGTFYYDMLPFFHLIKALEIIMESLLWKWNQENPSGYKVCSKYVLINFMPFQLMLS